MADLPETDDFPEGVYQLETTDPALGGAPNRATRAGLLNIPLLDLASRTRWARNRIQALMEAVVPATTAQPGIVRLSTAVTRASNVLAATASAVKAAYDRASAAHDRIAQAGISDADVVTNLDALTGTRMFFATATATGVPRPDLDYRGIHITSQSGAEHSQIVIGGTGFAAFRDFDDPAVGWGGWQQFMTQSSGASASWSSADAPDGWIIAESFRGDTDVTLGAVEATCVRFGTIAAISIRLNIAGFSIPVPSDELIQFELALSTLGVTAGFWGSGIASGGRAVAMGQLFGPAYDSPPVLFDVSANPATGRLSISNVDMAHMPPQSAPATMLRIDLQITLLVAD